MDLTTALTDYIKKSIARGGSNVPSSSLLGTLDNLVYEELNSCSVAAHAASSTLRGIVVALIHKLAPKESGTSITKKAAKSRTAAQVASGYLTVTGINPMKGELENGTLVLFSSKFVPAIGDYVPYELIDGAYVVTAVNKGFTKNGKGFEYQLRKAELYCARHADAAYEFPYLIGGVTELLAGGGAKWTATATADKYGDAYWEGAKKEVLSWQSLRGELQDTRKVYSKGKVYAELPAGDSPRVVVGAAFCGEYLVIVALSQMLIEGYPVSVTEVWSRKGPGSNVYDQIAAPNGWQVILTEVLSGVTTWAFNKYGTQAIAASFYGGLQEKLLLTTTGATASLIRSNIPDATPVPSITSKLTKDTGYSELGLIVQETAGWETKTLVGTCTVNYNFEASAVQVQACIKKTGYTKQSYENVHTINSLPLPPMLEFGQSYLPQVHAWPGYTLNGAQVSIDPTKAWISCIANYHSPAGAAEATFTVNGAFYYGHNGGGVGSVITIKYYAKCNPIKLGTFNGLDVYVGTLPNAFLSLPGVSGQEPLTLEYWTRVYYYDTPVEFTVPAGHFLFTDCLRLPGNPPPVPEDYVISTDTATATVVVQGVWNLPASGAITADVPDTRSFSIDNVTDVGSVIQDNKEVQTLYVNGIDKLLLYSNVQGISWDYSKLMSYSGNPASATLARFLSSSYGEKKELWFINTCWDLYAYKVITMSKIVTACTFVELLADGTSLYRLTVDVQTSEQHRFKYKNAEHGITDIVSVTDTIQVYVIGSIGLAETDDSGLNVLQTVPFGMSFVYIPAFNDGSIQQLQNGTIVPPVIGDYPTPALTGGFTRSANGDLLASFDRPDGSAYNVLINANGRLVDLSRVKGLNYDQSIRLYPVGR